MKLPAFLILLLTISTTQARLVTLSLPLDQTAQVAVVYTNDLAIAANETVEVVTYPRPGATIYFIKGTNYFASPTPSPDGITHYQPSTVFVGPDTVRLSGYGGNYVTVKIETQPEPFPPDKTIVIPAGGGANIALECSTNLIDWAAASPGVYTNQPAAKFFRIKAERVQ